MITIKRDYLIAGAILLVFLAVIHFKPTTKLGYYNPTPSAPKGYYLIHDDGIAPKRGDFVAISVPENVSAIVYGRGWMEPGTPLLKTVGALPGDVVTITDEELIINGQYRGPVLETDKEGLPLPKIRGTFVIPEGQFLPVSSYGRSFDGRYFGPVAISSVQHKLKPLLTF